MLVYMTEYPERQTIEKMNSIPLIGAFRPTVSLLQQ